MSCVVLQSEPSHCLLDKLKVLHVTRLTLQLAIDGSAMIPKMILEYFPGWLWALWEILTSKSDDIVYIRPYSGRTLPIYI